MELEARLRAFAAVVRSRSFSRAAETLHISQPAVSKHIAALEAELGTQLVVRARSGATLTPAGTVVADSVLRAEALLSHAEQTLAAGVDASNGTLTVAASPIPATYFLPQVLAEFRHRHPQQRSKSAWHPRWTPSTSSAHTAPSWPSSVPSSRLPDFTVSP